MNDSFLSVSTVPLPQDCYIASTFDSNPVRYEKVPQGRNDDSISFRQENDVWSPLILYRQLEHPALLTGKFQTKIRALAHFHFT
jgi:hypothetical protein